jgi:hypothetical protein
MLPNFQKIILGRILFGEVAGEIFDVVAMDSPGEGTFFFLGGRVQEGGEVSCT